MLTNVSECGFMFSYCESENDIWNMFFSKNLQHVKYMHLQVIGLYLVFFNYFIIIKTQIIFLFLLNLLITQKNLKVTSFEANTN